MPNWDDVRFFLALADAGSLAAAGRALGVQHTTVARRIAQLEEDLGVTLITRTPEGVLLTPAGQKALERARTAARELDGLVDAVQNDDERAAGIVRVTMSEAISGFFVRRLAELRTTYPELEIHVLRDNRTYDLSRGEADIAVRLTETQDPELRIKKLADLAWSLYASRGYVEAHGRPSSVEALRERALIGFGQALEHSTGAVWIRERGLGGQVHVHVNSILAALDAAIAGLGIAPLPCFLAHGEASLVRVLDEVLGVRTAHLVVHPDVARTRRVRVVLDFLAALVARERAILEGTSA